MGLSEVSNILWRERQLLTLLTFKLEVEQLLLTSGKTRFLAESTKEVEMVIDEIKETELVRSVEVDALASELGLPSNPSLKDLAAAVPAPWGTIFNEHRKEFLNATQEISAMASTNRELLAEGHKAAKDALEWIISGGSNKPGESGMPVDAYSSAGRANLQSQSGAKLIDEAI